MSTIGKRFPGEPLSKAEIDALLSKCSTRAPTGIRNRALITLLYRTGLRISEALALRPADVDLDRQTLRVLHGKGNKARTVGIDSATVTAIARWLDTRKPYVQRNSLLFCTLDGTPMLSGYVRDMLKRLATRANIGKRVHPHGLRHSCASDLVHEGVPLNVISKQLGHSSSAVTARYLDHIAPSEVIAMGRRRTW